MKRISALLLGLLLTGVFTLPAWGGTLTSNKFFYKPSLGARGENEKKSFEASLDRIDARLGKEIWVGDPNYGTTLQDALTAIGTTNNVILRISAGVWPITSQLIVPANVTLKFEDGAILDLTALPDKNIEAWSSASPSQITATEHGITNGTLVRPYNIRQFYLTTPATPIGEWMSFNDLVYTATVGGNPNTFTIPANSAAYHAYNPSDPGKVCVPIIIKGKIIAHKTKIFNVTSPAQVILGSSLAEFTANKTNDFYPEWFGAVGDGVTDDLAALNATLGAMHYSSYTRGVMHLSTWYGVSGTFSVNDLNFYNNGTLIIKGTGLYNSGLVGLAACSGHPIMELVGTPGVQLEDFGFTGITTNSGLVPANAPSVALLLGRSQFNPNSYTSWYRNLGFWGFFQYGLVYNNGNANSTWVNLHSYSSPLASDNLDNHWAFDFYNGGGHATSPFPTLLPIHSTFSTRANSSADTNLLRESYFSGTNYANKKAGNACIYQVSSDLKIDGIYMGGAFDYQVYAYNSPVDIANSGGDGAGTVAGIYVTGGEITAGVYPTGWSTNNATAKVRIENVACKNVGGIALYVDPHIYLLNSKVSNLQGNGAFKIQLGSGAMHSRFEELYNLSSFISNGIYFVNNYLEIPSTCQTLEIAGSSYLHNNIVKDERTGSRNMWLGGTTDVYIGQPGAATPNLFVGKHKITWAAAPPASGSWSQGSIIWNSGVAAGGSPGWVCVLDNTFGTLNSGATTGSITTGTKLLIVSTVNGLTVGNFIDVVADSGGNAVTAGRIVNIDATSKTVTLAANATATATDKAVSFHNHTTTDAFKAMANLQ